MKIVPVSCGPAANESEMKAFQQIKSGIISEPGSDEWIILTNLIFSVDHTLQSDEIDMIAIGPGGVRVIEIKHWSANIFNSNPKLVEVAARNLAMKARKLGTTLRKVVPSLPYVQGDFLLTEEPSKLKQLSKKAVHGARIFTLSEWKDAIGLTEPTGLSAQQVQQLADALHHKSQLAIDGSLRRLAGYVNLELQTPKDQRFHRIYKGNHSTRIDKVELHLYDLSAGDDKNAEAKARREFEALRRLQLYPWAPRILDSFQEAPGYEGEMYFFTVIDPAAPSLRERSTDTTWATERRLVFARNVVSALIKMHASSTEDEHIVHRNLTPDTILVKHDDTPILTGFEKTKIPSDVTVASTALSKERHLDILAPEVQSQGLGAADQRSDVYALCASLSQLFHDQADALGGSAQELLACGMRDTPSERATLAEIERALAELLGDSTPSPVAPPARFWTEEQVISFHDRDYRIVLRLGAGGVGTTFKVVEIDRATKEQMGTYVAKVAHEADMGQRVLRSYRLVQSHLGHANLSTIFEVASKWQENEFIALMKWVSGVPLADYIGVFPLVAEDQEEPSSEALAVRWLKSVVQGLGILHQNNLVHGDVSPRNLIVSGSDIVLTDYDFVVKIDDPLAAPGTTLYCSPSFQDSRPASPSDDIYALAASFFHVVFDREPFRYDGQLEKSRGLNWDGLDRSDYPTLAAFLEKATDPDPQLRFASVLDALAVLTAEQADAEEEVLEVEKGETTPQYPVEPIGQIDPNGKSPKLSEQRVDWLRSLLQSYPGSYWGNSETRGLDTDFAAQTYVETMLEATLLQDIRDRKVSLVILCGNAGDGKTALLQHLAEKLGMGRKQSAERILRRRIPDGPTIRMNLDGSASWQGRSADDLLDEFLEPFHAGPPTEDIAHLLAINDGRLLEWIEGVEHRRNEGSTSLTTALYNLLQNESSTNSEHIRFINLNQRSLVGGIVMDGAQIDTSFLDRLIDQLYGGEDAPAIWAPCHSCSAKDRCEVFRAAQIFGPDSLPTAVDNDIRRRARERLFEALQAVHLSGETHITMRELRAALVYIMFGMHFCDDFHGELDAGALPYWERAFLADSPARQGDLLAELAHHDPALDSHPQVDRYLVSAADIEDSNFPRRYPELSLDAARRRAFFEWTSDAIERVTEDPNSLDLARGQHLRRFRDLPLADAAELAETRDLLCKGISRLEDLPPQALDRPGIVPLRVTPRTPTETAFWVQKPLDAFRLEPDLPPEGEGIERLHHQAFLIYRYRDGRGEERLRLGAELFHLLLEQADGYQLGDVSTDAAFANLSIFVQRLVREDERELLAWNPMQEETIYRLDAPIRGTGNDAQQTLKINLLPQENDR